MSNEQKIWEFLKSEGLNDCGAAGLMGNLYAESGLSPTNLQNTYEKKLGYTDNSYTEAVDNGSYPNFVKDSAGYGLAQWTYWSRKQNLFEYAKATGKSIGDLEMQLRFLIKELKDYGLLDSLKSAASVLEASNLILLKFEKPASMNSTSTQNTRAGYGQTFYNKFCKTGGTAMSNSSLVTYTKITKNKTSPRTHTIDTITIHCIVGQWTAKQGCDYFASTDRQASANYVVGKDGSIGLSVDEKDRSWCSSNAVNDHRAITIEVASDTTHPYAITDAAYNALIELCADICKRNGIKKLIWSTDKNTRVNHLNGCNMTCHRDFANKACPGDYIYNREGAIAEAVNKKLGAATSTPTAPTTDSGLKVGDVVNFTGTKHYANANAASGTACKPGSAKITAVSKNAKHPYHLIHTGTDSNVYGWVDATDISAAGSAAAGSYTVRVTASVLNIRKGPGTNYGTNGSIKDKGVYTIVQESSGAGSTKGWGKLKSGAGWISLDYCTKL